MNVVRGNQYFGRRRQNDGFSAGPLSHRPTLSKSLFSRFLQTLYLWQHILLFKVAPRSANFRVRNQGSGVPEAWRNGASRTFNKTPVRPISASASLSSRPKSINTRDSSSVPRSAIRTSGTSSSSRSHATPSELRTPRSSTSIEAETSCIIAIAEGRGHARGEVGLAAIDTRRPHLILSQISDSQTYSNALAKINVFNPVEVLLPNTFCDAAQTNKLFSCIRDQYPHITVTTVQRRHFNDTRGLQLIQSLCAPEFSSVEVLVTHRFYALAAAAALLKYVEFIQNMIFAPKSLRVDYQGSQNTVLIDVDTAQRLELVRGVRGSSACSTPYSLLGTLNHCHTTGGLRLLRASLLQPPCLVEDIKQRLNCVEELVNNPALFHSLQAVLPKLADVEQLLALSMAAPTTGQASVRHAEVQLNYCLLLKSCLENIAPFSEALAEAQAPYFLAVKDKLQHEAFGEIMEHIQTVLHDDARATKGFSQANLQRCFAVKTGINGLLDVARKTYCELVDDITEMVSKYKEQHGLPLRVGFSSTRGFHVQLSLSGPNGRLRSADLPPIFIQVVKTRGTVTMTTQEMVHADQRCKDALQEIQTMSNVVISELLAETRQHAGCLYQLCEAVAQVDLVMALASVSVLPGYVRPDFGNQLCVQASRHPILAFLHHTEPIANDIFASVDKNFHILTGPNMGGKSIYIRQVALLQILAQIGCFVPAESATFRVADRIFSRIGFDDSIECNASTFVVEMREMQFILQNMTPNSLIIVDELCRGTSSEEGTAIAWALCERLLSSPAFTYFTTHFLFLTRLQDVYPNVANHHMEATEKRVDESSTPGGTSVVAGTGAEAGEMPGDGEETWIRYTHRLLPGVTKLERYGIRLAKLSLMPKSVTARADTLLKQLIQARKPLPEVQGSDALELAYFGVCGEVIAAAEECKSDPEALRERCKEIQARFVAEYPDWQEHVGAPSTPLPSSITSRSNTKQPSNFKTPATNQQNTDTTHHNNVSTHKSLKPNDSLSEKHTGTESSGENSLQVSSYKTPGSNQQVKKLKMSIENTQSTPPFQTLNENQLIPSRENGNSYLFQYPNLETLASFVQTKSSERVQVQNTLPKSASTRLSNCNSEVHLRNNSHQKNKSGSPNIISNNRFEWGYDSKQSSLSAKYSQNKSVPPNKQTSKNKPCTVTSGELENDESVITQFKFLQHLRQNFVTPEQSKYKQNSKQVGPVPHVSEPAPRTSAILSSDSSPHAKTETMKENKDQEQCPSKAKKIKTSHIEMSDRFMMSPRFFFTESAFTVASKRKSKSSEVALDDTPLSPFVSSVVQRDAEGVCTPKQCSQKDYCGSPNFSPVSECCQPGIIHLPVDSTEMDVEEEQPKQSQIKDPPMSIATSPQLHNSPPKSPNQPETTKDNAKHESPRLEFHTPNPAVVKDLLQPADMITPTQPTGQDPQIIDVTPTPCEEAAMPETVGSPSLPAPSSAECQPSEMLTLDSEEPTLASSVVSPVYVRIRPKQKRVIQLQEQQAGQQEQENVEAEKPLTSSQFLNTAGRKED